MDTNSNTNGLALEDINSLRPYLRSVLAVTIEPSFGSRSRKVSCWCIYTVSDEFSLFLTHSGRSDDGGLNARYMREDVRPSRFCVCMRPCQRDGKLDPLAPQDVSAVSLRACAWMSLSSYYEHDYADLLSTSVLCSFNSGCRDCLDDSHAEAFPLLINALQATRIRICTAASSTPSPILESRVRMLECAVSTLR